MLEPDARKACKSGSEGGRAQQCARPTRRSGRCVVTDLETGEALLDHVEVGEVVGRERFSLDYGEVDLYLV